MGKGLPQPIFRSSSRYTGSPGNHTVDPPVADVENLLVTSQRRTSGAAVGLLTKGKKKGLNSTENGKFS